MSAAFKTTEMILSFPSLAVPRKGREDWAAKYQATLVEIPGVTDMDAIKAAFVEAGKEKHGDKFSALLKKASFKRALKKVEEGDEDARYPVGTYFINAYSPEDQKPQVVDRFADPATGKPRRITSDEEIREKFYAGCHVRAVIRFYGYADGVACAVNSLQWLGDGPRLDNRVAAEDAFDAEEQDTADLEVTEVEVAEAPKAKARAKAAPKADAGDLRDLL